MDARIRLKILGGFALAPFLLPLISCTSLIGPEQQPTDDSTSQEQGTTTKNVIGDQPAFAQTDDITVPRDCTLSRLLNFYFPGWQLWQGVPNVIGDGIWSIPGRIENGMCHIYVNGTLVIGPNVNVNTIQLNRGDLLDIRPAA